MEEIVGSEAIQGEILDDARKKAARILEEAEAEAAREVADIEAKAAEVVAEIVRENEAKAARYRMETMARFPLERTRMRTVFVEASLRDAARGYVEALAAGRVATLSEAMLAKSASFFSGKDVLLRRKGLPEEEARSIASRSLSAAASLRHEEDSLLPAPGLVAEAVDGSVVFRATMDLVEAELLDERRGELAHALCGEALEL
jgi:V/A-type H+/Na+-transporting ATPase subunit E